MIMSKAKSASQEFQMTTGSIPRAIFLYSIPLIIGNFLQQLYNTMDSLIVGNFVGPEALAAVGASGTLTFLLISFCIGASSGAGILISRYFGGKDYDELDKAVHTTIALSIVMGAVISVLGIILTPLLVRAVGTTKPVVPQAELYLRIYFLGVIFNVIYNMASGILNAVGDSKRSLRYLAIASITNIVLDFVFVAIFDMGIAGAAIATDISQLVSCVCIMGYLFRTNAAYHVTFKKIHLHKKTAVSILKLGIPTAIQNAVIAFSNMLIQAGVNVYGTSAMAGFTAYMKVDGFNILPIMSFSLAATTFTGQNIGAGRFDRVKKGLYTVVVMGLIYTIGVSVIMLSFAKPIITMLSRDPHVIQYGVMALWSLAPYYCLLSIIHTLAGTVRGSGKTLPPMVIILFSLCLCRIAWIHLVAPHFNSIWGVYYTYPISFIIGAILMILYTWKGKWMEIKRL